MKRPPLLYLTGMMGSGKTTVGKIVAARLGWRFLDTDQLVARRAGKSVATIFRTRGETEFRRLESAALKNVKPGRGTVLATGGGMVLKSSNRAWMKKHGVVLHLALGAVSITRRLRGAEAAGRPLLSGGLGAIREIARQRAKYYATADLKIAASASPGVLARRILKLLKEKTPQVLHDKTAR